MMILRDELHLVKDGRQEATILDDRRDFGTISDIPSTENHSYWGRKLLHILKMNGHARESWPTFSIGAWRSIAR